MPKEQTIVNIDVNTFKQGYYERNNFDYPNWYSDHLDYFLTPTETKVLAKMIREILGWRDYGPGNPIKKIPLSVITDGRHYKDRNGQNVHILGCGLQRKAVQKALASLCTFRVIRREKTNTGYVYKLMLNTDDIDWIGLEARRAQLEQKYSAYGQIMNRAKAEKDADHES